MHLLIVEDNKFILSLIKAALRSFKGEVLAAHNQEEAIQIYNRYQPEIVLSDLHMDQGTTWDLLTKLSEQGLSQVFVVSSDTALLARVKQELHQSDWVYINKNNNQWLQILKKSFQESILKPV